MRATYGIKNAPNCCKDCLTTALYPVVKQCNLTSAEFVIYTLAIAPTNFAILQATRNIVEDRSVTSRQKRKERTQY